MLSQTEKNISGNRVQGKYIVEHYRKFGGVHIAKNWAELFQLEVFLNENKFARIIELGTGYGGTTILMALNAFETGTVLYTFDTKLMDARAKNILERLNANVYQEDIFKIEERIGRLIKTAGRTLLYCDNGNKPEELRIFGKYLKKGDVVIVHDYGEEVKADFILKMKTLHGLDILEYDFFQNNFTSLHLGLVKL